MRNFESNGLKSSFTFGIVKFATLEGDKCAEEKYILREEGMQILDFQETSLEVER